MVNWIFIIDVAKCEDCNNCFLACKDEFTDNDFPPYSIAQPRHGQRWMNIERKERGQFPLVDVAFLPVPCQHCANAPCVTKAKDGAVYKNSEGIVLIDPVKSKGQKGIVDSCPYGAIWWNEAKQVPQKCTLCVHLLNEGWKEPRCVQACPTGVLRFTRIADSKLAQIIEDEGLEVLYPEYNTRPHIFYKNLYRFNKCFIAGSVAVQNAGITDCAPGARVTLYQGSEIIAETETDTYGDFKFDGLDENSGGYRLEILLNGYEKNTLDVSLTTSKNVGIVYLV